MNYDADNFDYLDMTGDSVDNELLSGLPIGSTLEGEDMYAGGYVLSDRSDSERLDTLADFAERWKDRLQTATFTGDCVRHSKYGVILKAKVGGLFIGNDEIAVLDEEGDIYATV